MAILERYLEDVDRNNMLLQRAIRDIDSRTFVEALCGLDGESRAALFRNLSRRAAEELDKDLAERQATVGPEAVRSALSSFLRLLAKHARHADVPIPEKGAYPDAPSTLRQWRDALLVVAQAQWTEDYEFIEQARGRSGDPLMREALRLVLDETDPLEARQRLERVKALALADEERRMDMLIDALCGMRGGEGVGQTAERMDPYLHDA